MNNNHLISEAVCWVKEIPRIREQDKFSDRFAGGDRPIRFHHISQRLNPSPCKCPGALLEGTPVALQLNPIQDCVVIGLRKHR
jgi:hypothetical protein